MATITTGWHRFANVTTQSNFGPEQIVVPGAQVYVTLTSTGAAATIYLDPAMSVAIPGSRVTADIYGNYQYFIPLNYNVTETISSPNGLLLTISNISQNGPLVGSLVTTSASSDTVAITGILTTSHVSLQATNASAATMLYTSPGVYVSSKSAGSITVTHPSTAGATFDIIVTPY